LQSDASNGTQLIVLSAKSAPALDQRMAQLESYLAASPSPNLANVAFTLQVGRKPFRHRQAIVASGVDELKAALQARSSPSNKLKALRTENAPADAARVAFLFPGQGSQYVNMGRDLYASEPVFRDAVDRCCKVLGGHLQFDLRSVLYPGNDGEDEAARQLAQTANTQPALFVIEYAMAQLWMSCGVRPAAMLGHSVGEYVAACLAGVFSLEDALALIAERGRLIQSLPGGTMLAVNLTEQDLEPLLSPELSIAAVNSAGQTVASGSDAAIAALEAALQRRKIQCRRLRTSHAFHSPMMEAILARFVERVAQVELHPPTLKYLSNVTGTWIKPEQATDPAYWGAHLRRTVRFAECAATLTADADLVLLEVGPGDALLSLVRGKNSAADKSMAASMRHALAAENDRDFWLNAAGRLWLWNAPLEWTGLHAGQRRLKLSLPVYPFQRQRYYVEPRKIEPDNTSQKSAIVPLFRSDDLTEWFYAPSWRRSVAEVLPQDVPTAGEAWLVLAEDGPLITALRSGLGVESALIQVRSGPGFRRASTECYEIDPAKRADYDQLLRDLSARELWPERIIHGFLTGRSADATLDRAIDLGVYSALTLMQGIEAAAPGKPIVLNVVTDRAYSVFGEDTAMPVAAALNAFCKGVPVELPSVTARIIDVDLETNFAQASQQIIRELKSIAVSETVAYRGNSRWVATHEPLQLPESLFGQDDSEVVLRPGGTYILTGGTGGIGLVLARHIAQRTRGTLVLTSRTAFPPAGEWPTLLAAVETPESLKQKIQGLQKIQAWGGEVVVLQADTADADAMRDSAVRPDPRDHPCRRYRQRGNDCDAIERTDARVLVGKGAWGGVDSRGSRCRRPRLRPVVFLDQRNHPGLRVSRLRSRERLSRCVRDKVRQSTRNARSLRWMGYLARGRHGGRGSGS
jgi:acyl transferase domain-containing protein